MNTKKKLTKSLRTTSAGQSVASKPGDCCKTFNKKLLDQNAALTLRLEQRDKAYKALNSKLLESKNANRALNLEKQALRLEKQQALRRQAQDHNLEMQRAQEEIQKGKEEIKRLKDDLAAAKKRSKKPKLKGQKLASKKPKEGTENGTRAGSEKRSKNIDIHNTVIIKPEGLPAGAKLKRQRTYDVQDIKIELNNTRYILEEWLLPDGTTVSAQMPKGVSQNHFGHQIITKIMYLYHQNQTTQPLILEMLHEMGIDISSGQLHNILTENNDAFHSEKDSILETALNLGGFIQVDDTGARHEGKNGFCTQFGNELFAWFKSTTRKSRVNFLEILASPYHGNKYVLDELALDYMVNQKLPKIPLEKMKDSLGREFANKDEWMIFLKEQGITAKSHVRKSTEAALLSAALAGGLPKDLIILSDGARQFVIPFLLHALCWVHEARHIRALVPIDDETRKEQEEALDDIWYLYGMLKDYKTAPSEDKKEDIILFFDALFGRVTSFEALNKVFKNIYDKKEDLLLVLDHPEVPLHNNASEGDIREFVKRRKVSGGTKSEAGRASRDTFASLKKTCRKLGISFYAYLNDRISGRNKIPPIKEVMKKVALERKPTPILKTG